MAFLQGVFNQAPDIALFLSLAGGYWIGKFQFGKFQLGSVAGSLLVAVLISQVGHSDRQRHQIRSICLIHLCRRFRKRSTILQIVRPPVAT